MSLTEASDFWDEHDFLEFDDMKEVKNICFKIAKRKYIGVDEQLYRKVARRAKRLKTSVEHLVSSWLKEKAV